MPKKYDAITKTRLMNMVDTFYRDGAAALCRRFPRKDRTEAAFALRHIALMLERSVRADPPDAREMQARLRDIEDSALGQECKRLGVVEFSHEA